MKTSVIIFIAVELLLFFNINKISAAIITVDNKHPYIGDYQTLQEAHDAASAGDTIFVNPSLVPYVGITVTKQLAFYGVGFEITENFGEPVTPTSTITDMAFNSGSEGSLLEGFDGQFAITISAGNIVVRRNFLYRAFINVDGSGSVILQNKIIGSGRVGPSSTYYTVWIEGTNILLLNNIIINPNDSGSDYGIVGGTNLSIINNVLKAADIGLAVSGSEITNNIIVDGGISASGSVRYNMSHSTDPVLTGGIGNLVNVDMSTVLVDHPNYDFHLSPGSPAIGTGENGTDMGIYGGETPYVDSGFPGLPSILHILAPTVGSQEGGLDILFDAKSNKE